MTAQEATAQVFFAAFKALSRREQETVLALMGRDKKLRRVLEEISDRLIIEEERPKPSRPLRDYIEEREQRERVKAKARR